MHKLAIYDMDKTITVAPTWTAFLVTTAWHETPWRLVLLPLAGMAVAEYAAGLLDRARLKEVTQRLLLGASVSGQQVERAAEQFAERIVASGVFAGAREQIEADRRAGYRLVMATASYRFYAEAIARRLGFDEVTATQVTRDAAGRVLARIDGENCYGPAKLRMIEAWMASSGIARAEAQVRFYSDHVSDAPTLAWADAAIAVNPHQPLRLLAAERGWTIVDWPR